MMRETRYSVLCSYVPGSWRLLFMLPVVTRMAMLAYSLEAIEPFKLESYPQKIRTFYNLHHTEVPTPLRSNAVPLPAGNITAAIRTTDGALWLGTTQGLMRLDLSANERDRRQYFAGKRYLPDDSVEQLLADEHAGIWSAREEVSRTLR